MDQNSNSVHNFNFDLQLDEEDRKNIELEYPDVAHLMVFPELVTFFKKRDEKANAAKNNSRLAGYFSVCFVTVALLGAAAEPLYHNIDPTYQNRIAIGLSILGIVGFILAASTIVYGKSKKNWMLDRLVTERLRQFHFQTFICRIPEIIQSLEGAEKRNSFIALRNQWLAHFDSQYVNNLALEFDDIVNLDRVPRKWLHPNSPSSSEHEIEKLPNSFFDSYYSLRITHQFHYAQLQTSEDGSGLIQKRRRIETVTTISVGLLLLIHIYIILSFFFDFSFLSSALVHVLGICFAIVGLSAHTLEEGLKTKSELERYRQYRFEIYDIMIRYQNTKSKNEKYQLMIEMERLSFNELRDFLITNNHAKFVM